MEKFAVDLDQVLDDFELNEDNEPAARDANHSHFQGSNDHGRGGAISDQRTVLDLPLAQPNLHRVPPEMSNFATIMYDAPYEAPNKVNASQTNLAFSSQTSQGSFQPDLINNHSNLNGRFDDHLHKSVNTASDSVKASPAYHQIYSASDHQSATPQTNMHTGHYVLASQYHGYPQTTNMLPSQPGVLPSAPMVYSSSGDQHSDIANYNSENMNHPVYPPHPAYTSNNAVTCLSMHPQSAEVDTLNNSISNRNHDSQNQDRNFNKETNILNDSYFGTSSQDRLVSDHNYLDAQKREMEPDTGSETSVQESVSSTMSSLSPPSGGEYTNIEPKSSDPSSVQKNVIKLDLTDSVAGQSVTSPDYQLAMATSPWQHTSDDVSIATGLSADGSTLVSGNVKLPEQKAENVESSSVSASIPTSSSSSSSSLSPDIVEKHTDDQNVDHINDEMSSQNSVSDQAPDKPGQPSVDTVVHATHNPINSINTRQACSAPESENVELDSLNFNVPPLSVITSSDDWSNKDEFVNKESVHSRGSSEVTLDHNVTTDCPSACDIVSSMSDIQAQQPLDSNNVKTPDFLMGVNLSKPSEGDDAETSAAGNQPVIEVTPQEHSDHQMAQPAERMDRSSRQTTDTHVHSTAVSMNIDACDNQDNENAEVQISEEDLVQETTISREGTSEDRVTTEEPAVVPESAVCDTDTVVTATSVMHEERATGPKPGLDENTTVSDGGSKPERVNQSVTVPAACDSVQPGDKTSVGMGRQEGAEVVKQFEERVEQLGEVKTVVEDTPNLVHLSVTANMNLDKSVGAMSCNSNNDVFHDSGVMPSDSAQSPFQPTQSSVETGDDRLKHQPAMTQCLPPDGAACHSDSGNKPNNASAEEDKQETVLDSQNNADAPIESLHQQHVEQKGHLDSTNVTKDCNNVSQTSDDHINVQNSVSNSISLNPLYEAIHNAEIPGESPHATLEDQMLRQMLDQPLEFESLIPTSEPATLAPSVEQPASSQGLATSVVPSTGEQVASLAPPVQKTELDSIEEQMRNGGARPKDTSMMKKSRPNSLLGLSTVSMDSKLAASAPVPINAEVSSTDDVLDSTLTQSADHALQGLSMVDSAMNAANSVQSGTPQNSHDIINRQLAQQTNHSNVLMRKKQINMEIKQQIDSQAQQVTDNRTIDSAPSTGGDESLALPSPQVRDIPFPFQDADPNSGSAPVMLRTQHGRPSSAPPNFLQPPNPLPGAPVKQKRPTSLNLPPRSQFPTQPPPGFQEESEEVPEATPTNVAQGQAVSDSAENLPQNTAEAGMTDLVAPPPAYSVSHPELQLGKVPPQWIPDSEASNCMLCDARFTFTKRRHHCRACGKVFCSTCCNLRCKLDYMENKEARVCSICFQAIFTAQARMNVSAAAAAASPNPNNPSEYCSTIPPLQQAAGTLNAPPPTVMVPVGVLKREGSQRRGEPKQVMFSDGIRPGGDLTELDGSSEQQHVMPKRGGRTQKKVERPSAPVENSSDNQPKPMKPAAVKTKTLKASDSRRNPCLIPAQGLPPVILSTGVKGDYSIEENPDSEKILPQIRSTDDQSPVIFALNKNLLVMVKILNLDCCVNRVCWCFTTRGLCTVGQDEMMVVLEYLPEEKTIPLDIFRHFQSIYEEASKGNTVGELGHTIFSQPFLGTRDHGGFLYIRSTFQCVQKLFIPNSPFLVGVLLQKWETPWAKVFPLRLMLRLGAEYRYYPCPLISVRNRKPVFGEIGHTIMNLLADFRNYQYMLPQIRGISIHMEDKKTYINFPRNRYSEVMKVINNSNDHVVALGSNFSTEADSHLVCMQNEDGNYQTQAINIQNKPRKKTGASFVVFNGALKTSSGLSAKSSIVEDGLMVQISAEAMMTLKTSLRDMTDYTIGCGSLDSPQPEELVITRWVDDDRNVNIGVKSPIDNKCMDGIESVRINNATDYVGENKTIRWTEVFFLQSSESDSHCEPVDLSRLAETLASACSMALTPHLDKLKEAGLTKIGLRVTVDTEQVGYEVGSNGEKLPTYYMNELDNELIPVIHNAASQSQDNLVAMELIFYIID